MQTFDENDRRTAAELLERVGCTPMTTRPLASCSQGERQRVMLARALFGRPELLLLDEPMAGLDLPGRELLLDALSSTAHSAPPTILVTHHLEEIPRTVTHAALMRAGITVAAGQIEAVLTDDQVSACFGIPISVSSTQGRWSGKGPLDQQGSER
jgi:iron complex transport system ATP-binding protein